MHTNVKGNRNKSLTVFLYILMLFYFWCCFFSFFFFQTRSYIVQAGFKFTTQPRMTLNLNSDPPASTLPNAAFTNVCHHTLFKQSWGTEPRTSCLLGQPAFCQLSYSQAFIFKSTQVQSAQSCLRSRKDIA